MNVGEFYVDVRSVSADVEQDLQDFSGLRR
jgi:hypothetical protein